MSSQEKTENKNITNFKRSATGVAALALFIGFSNYWDKLFPAIPNQVSDEVFGEYLSFLAKYGKT